ncbi:MAG: FeoB-associated Cys-rich membrane protein [Lachnospiraceae bacterium]|nr:FeoB-associated Cys-rich membrane protein [Lachnospiraceae bacterium]
MMNLIDFLVILGLVIITAAICIYLVKRKKQGKQGCGGCPEAGKCHGGCRN